MYYSVDKDEYSSKNKYHEKIQKKFNEAKAFLSSNGFKTSSESLINDIASTQDKNYNISNKKI